LKSISEIIKNKALELGFSACGISKSDFLSDNKIKLEEWLAKGYNAEMQYMENYKDKRLDTKLLVENSKSVISVLMNYYPEELQNKNCDYKISKYAYGKDYHFVIKEKLQKLFDFINENIAKTEGRIFVDSAPVLERAWAKKSGLGWIGKNSLLITKKGSYFFIGEIICDIELEPDSPINEYCGTCTKCIDACPTNAITEPYVVNANKCISFQTIEKKGVLDKKTNLFSWIFGCDICQDVCPWNKNSMPTSEKLFIPHPKLLENTKSDWENLNKSDFNEIFKKSGVKRTKYEGFMRNIKQNSNH